MPTEQEILERLVVAQGEYEQAQKSLARAKKIVITAETEAVNCKIVLDQIKEELRVHRATIPSTHPEISQRELEIEKFRQDNPEIVAFAKERDLGKS